MPGTDLITAATAADVLLTMISFGSDRQIIPMEALARASLVVAVDYDMCIPAEFARRSSIFVTDDIPSSGDQSGRRPRRLPRSRRVDRRGAVRSRSDARESGPVYVNHLGVGLADVVFADAIVRRATDLGLGTTLLG